MKKNTNHFDTIAEHFNRIWYFSDGYKDFIITHILNALAFESDDILVDIGGGTGTFTSRLQHEGKFNLAYCVEPSKAMCAEAAKQINIQSICTDAMGFLDSNYKFSKMLFKEVIHHIPERDMFFKKCYESLPKRGQLLIITRPKEIEFPFFETAKSVFSKNQPSHGILENELVQSGFHISTSHYNYTFSLPKESWYEMLRHRFMSDLSIFSDEEIEIGINEIEMKYLENQIDITDHLIFICAIKS